MTRSGQRIKTQFLKYVFTTRHWGRFHYGFSRNLAVDVVFRGQNEFLPTQHRLDSYRAIIKQVLTEYSTYTYAYGEIERQLVFDRSRDHYLMMSVGWGKRRVHGCLIHVDLIDGKCWIQRDGTESGIARDLEAAGIPKDRIVLAFRPPEVRPHTGYAVA